jgi:hypothetical protein
MFWSAGYSIFRAGGFSCSLDALHEGLVINKSPFLLEAKDFYISGTCEIYSLDIL